MTKNSHGIPTTKSRKSVDEDIKCRNDKISAHKAEIGAIERKVYYDSANFNLFILMTLLFTLLLVD